MGRAYQQTRVLVTASEPGAPSSIRPRPPDADSPEPMRHEPTRGRPSDLAAASRGGELVHGISRTMLPSPFPDGLWPRPLELQPERSPIVRRIRCPVHAVLPGRRLTPPRRDFPPEVRPSPRQTMPSPRSSSFLALLLARSRLLASTAASPIRPSERANSADWMGIAGAHIVSDVCRIRSALRSMRILASGSTPRDASTAASNRRGWPEITSRGDRSARAIAARRNATVSAGRPPSHAHLALTTRAAPRAAVSPRRLSPPIIDATSDRIPISLPSDINERN